jgi:hypothetical protein
VLNPCILYIGEVEVWAYGRFTESFIDIMLGVALIMLPRCEIFPLFVRFPKFPVTFDPIMLLVCPCP